MNADKKARDFSYLLQQTPKVCVRVSLPRRLARCGSPLFLLDFLQLSTPAATQTPADDAEDDEDAVGSAP